MIVRPNYLALCHADQRYYRGRRTPKVLKQKLPMALVHECCAVVVHDPTGAYRAGDKVVLIPNQPPASWQQDEFYENYAVGTHFLSSGYDGFMQEFVSLPPDRIVGYRAVPDKVAAITEFVSVAAHAIDRFQKAAHLRRDRIVVWGSGSLAYVISTLIKEMLPASTLIVVGRNPDKMSLFSFADETYLLDEIGENFDFDHAFEAVGGEGCHAAYRDIIQYIRPQGTVMMMGVSETEVPLNTRDILEKGLTLIGSSRSGRLDFEQAVIQMEKPRVSSRLKLMVHEFGSIQDVQDIYRFFEEDMKNPFKTVAKWEI
ncbi:MAG: zinc-binding dehydrogenase [Lachnospiraceae bacterium]|nr:zinc-binding dehydrogenase [Lachnospiraceae bacterium]